MRYLNQLKKVISEKCPVEELKELQKGASFCSFSTLSEHFLKSHGQNDENITTDTPYRQQVLATLSANPELRYALISHDEPHPDAMILTLGIQDVGTCELSIPKAKYDALRICTLLDTLQKRI